MNTTEESLLKQNNELAFKSYPIDRPFINTNWTRSSYTLSKAFPESNRDLIMSSLKSLQDKINRLELKSDHKFESNILKDVQNIEIKKFDLNNQTILTENRISELEKQLEKMRKMIDEHDGSTNKIELNSMDDSQRIRSFDKTPLFNNVPYNTNDRSFDIYSQKPKEILDEKICFSKSYHKHRSPTNKRLIRQNENFSYINGDKQTKLTKKLKRSNSIDTGPCYPNKPASHYRLNIGDIPFVVGKSVTPSHHLGSNIQKVISLLKMHHPKLCNSVIASRHYQPLPPSSILPNEYQFVARTDKKKRTRSLSVPSNQQPRDGSLLRSSLRSSASSECSNNKYSAQGGLCEYLSEHEIKDILRHLQEEYTKLVLEHYEVTKKLINCTDPIARDELDNKASDLDIKMRIKSNQIAKLKSHQIKNLNSRQSEKSNHKHENRQSRITSKQIKATSATIRNASPKNTFKRNDSSVNFNANNNNNEATIDKSHYKSLKLFKDLKTLQTRLINDQIRF